MTLVVGASGGRLLRGRVGVGVMRSLLGPASVADLMLGALEPERSVSFGWAEGQVIDATLR